MTPGPIPPAESAWPWSASGAPSPPPPRRHDDNGLLHAPGDVAGLRARLDWSLPDDVDLACRFRAAPHLL